MSSSFSRVAPPPPRRIVGAADVARLRRWAFAALADGRGEQVVATLAALDVDAVPGAAWADAWSELHARAGIALSSPEHVLRAAEPLADGGAGALEPVALLAVAVGAGWLVEEAARHDGPAARFGAARPWLTAARWTLARLLGGGYLDDAHAEEAAAALDALYRGAWRVAEAGGLEPGPSDVGSGPAGPEARMELERELDAVRHAAPARQEACVAAVLARVAAAAGAGCERGPWWTSAAHGARFSLAAPRDDAERHRFALADVFLELDELAGMPLDPEDELLCLLTAAHRHELAQHAVAHARQAGLPLP